MSSDTLEPKPPTSIRETFDTVAKGYDNQIGGLISGNGDISSTQYTAISFGKCRVV